MEGRKGQIMYFDVFNHLYKRTFTSIGPSVQGSVCPSVYPYVDHAINSFDQNRAIMQLRNQFKQCTRTHRWAYGPCSDHLVSVSVPLSARMLGCSSAYIIHLSFFSTIYAIFEHMFCFQSRATMAIARDIILILLLTNLLGFSWNPTINHKNQHSLSHQPTSHCSKCCSPLILQSSFYSIPFYVR